MVRSVFYDSSELDRIQLSQLLDSSKYQLVFIETPIAVDSIDPEAEIISVFVSSTVTKAMIDSMPKLRLIACRSTGFNNIDMTAATERGIAVVNVPTYGEHTVAEFAFTLILALSRKLLPAAESIMSGIIEPSNLQGLDLHGKTIGVIGAGHIGQYVITIAKGFGMRVVAFDPFPKEGLDAEMGFTYGDLPALMASSDVITIHAPYTPDNHHLINEQLLANVKPSAILVNTARGEIIDTKALIAALDNGSLAGAGLDVVESESLLDIDEERILLNNKTASKEWLEHSVELRILEKMPNVILTPHNAFNTAEAIQRINATTSENIAKFWQGAAQNIAHSPKPTMGKFLLVRHGESEWNAKGVWTGSTDVHLTEKGFHEAALLGRALTDVKIDYAYASQQIRSLETLEGVLDASQQFDVPFERVAAINERDYGDYTGQNKWQVKELIGEDAFNHLRRDWDYPVPHGETLKMVFERAVPFYLGFVLPRLKNGQNVLVVAHGNSIRSLVKYIENMSDTAISDLEMPFGDVLIYKVDENGHVIEKEDRKIDTTPPPA